jgi:adenylate kinase
VSTLPEDVQAIHDRWLADKVAAGEVDEGLGGPDGNLYYADDDDFWREFDGLQEAVWVEAEHPRDWRGRWIPKFVLSPIGIPGSGKGTIGKLLAEHYGVPHISTGDMFRALPRDSDLGRQVFPLIEQGNLVPDEVTARIVRDRLAQPDVRDGVVLDGFPRTERQKNMLEAMGVPFTYLELDVGRDVAVDRLLKRAKIEGRADDTPDVIANRFRVYDTETEPMMERLRIEGQIVTVPVTDAGPEVNAARAKEALAPLRLNEAYIERLHPRDRLGRWIDVPDFRGVGGAAPSTFRTPGLKVSAKQGRAGRRVTARGWAARVGELRNFKVLEQDRLLARRQEAMAKRGAPWKTIGDVSEPTGYEKGNWRVIATNRRDDLGRLVTGYDVYVGETHRGWVRWDPSKNIQDVFEEAAPGAEVDPFLDEWWGAPGRRGRYQTMGGDPGTAFEEQHERIMEAGALIDAEVRKRGKESEKRLADLVKRYKAKKAETKRLAAEEERLAYEETARVLHAQFDWVDVSGYGPPKPEDVKRRHRVYERERNKRRPDMAVLSANNAVADAWQYRYENPDGRVQAAHDAYVQAMWSREEGNEGADVLADQVRAARKELHWTRRANTYEVLEEVRPFASEGDLDHIRDLNTGNEDNDRRLKHASSWLPLAWVRSSNEHETTLAVGSEPDRGKYIHAYIGSLKPEGRNISLLLGSPSPEAPGIDKGVSTMLHELVHRVEHTRDGVKGAEWTFYASRVSPGINRKWEDTHPLFLLTGNGGYEQHEMARPDKFTDFYSGKTYGDNPDSSYEILTMGIQDLVTGEHGIVMDDDEYRQFVLGAMALL